MTPTTLQQKIAGLFLLGFRGSRVEDSPVLADDIRQRRLGGVILFDRLLSGCPEGNNITSPTQVSNLTRQLQELGEGNLLIAVDQEGGKVNRFKGERGFPESPEAIRQGNQDDPAVTAFWASQTASMLGKAGINWNLAPVVDLAVEPENPIISRYGRSFGRDPDTVSRHCRIWVETHRANGIGCCLKHFPGHGSSRQDSHLGFVDISDSWNEQELLPYRRLIEADLADAIMIGHLFNRGLDPVYPSSLSGATIRTLLRETLHFTGLVVSDDMQMRAITDHYGLEEGCCLALAAGVDLLIVGNNLNYDPCLLEQLIAGVEDGVKKGLVSEQRIETAWEKVRAFTRQLTGN